MSHPQKIEAWRPTVLPDGRWLLFHQGTRTVHTLSAPAGILWELCDGQTSLAGLIDQMREFYPDTESAELQRQVEQILQEFREQDLVTVE